MDAFPLKILIAILSKLPQSSLFNVALTSTTLARTTSSLLYSSVNVPWSMSNAFLQALDSSTTRSVAGGLPSNYGAQVKKLTFSGMEWEATCEATLVRILRHCVYLTDLAFFHTALTDFAFTAALAITGSTLCRLCSEGNSFTSTWKGLGILCTGLEQMRVDLFTEIEIEGLQCLELVGFCNGEGIEELLGNNEETLEELVLEPKEDFVYDEGIFLAIFDCRQLKRLKIDKVDIHTEVDDSVWDFMGKRLSNLEFIDIPSIVPGDYLVRLVARNINLKSMEIRVLKEWPVEFKDVVGIVLGGKKLESLNLFFEEKPKFVLFLEKFQDEKWFRIQGERLVDLRRVWRFAFVENFYENKELLEAL